MGIFKKLKQKFNTEQPKDEVLDAIQKKNKEKKHKIYDKGLKKSRNIFSKKLEKLALTKKIIDEDLFEELEEILIMADVGAGLTMKIIDSLKETIKKENITDPKLINDILFDQIFSIYVGKELVSTKLNIQKDRTNIIMVTGVNGSGKTTSIAKIANELTKDGNKVLLAAADTFRAGAVEQLQVWTDRMGVDIVVPDKVGQDPSSVIFKAVKKAKEENYDVLLCDTAGRLQNKDYLMKELNKMYGVIKKEFPDAPHESLLVIDATTGQNGINQAIAFKEASHITGIILSKMDGTAKGGIILAIKELLDIPVKFIGLGEQIEDLQEFDLDEYLYALTKNFVDKV